MVALERLLQELEAEIVSFGVPFAGAPGASASDFDRLAETTGIVLPEEATTWFSWHNGPATGIAEANPLWNRPPRQGQLGGGWYLMSLDEAVASREQWLEAGRRAEANGFGTAEEVYPPHFFPFLTSASQATGVIHTAFGLDHGAVDVVDTQSMLPEDLPQMESISAFVKVLLEMYRLSLFRWSDVDGLLETAPPTDQPDYVRHTMMYF